MTVTTYIHLLIRNEKDWNYISKKYKCSYILPVFRHAQKIQKINYWLHHVHLSICIEQLGSHWTKKAGILVFFQKLVENVQV